MAFTVILPETLDTLYIPNTVPVVQRLRITWRTGRPTLSRGEITVTVRWYTDSNTGHLDLRGRLAGELYASGVVAWLGDRKPTAREQRRVDLMVICVEQVQAGVSHWQMTETEARHWGLLG